MRTKTRKEKPLTEEESDELQLRIDHLTPDNRRKLYDFFFTNRYTVLENGDTTS